MMQSLIISASNGSCSLEVVDTMEDVLATACVCYVSIEEQHILSLGP